MAYETISITIDLQTQALPAKSFSIPEIFTNEVPLDEEFEQGTSRSYSSLDELAVDFDSSEITYNKAAELFSQEDGPIGEFRVYLREDAVQRVMVADFGQAPASGDIINITINGTAITPTNFTDDGDTTLGLVAAKIADLEGIDTAEVDGNTIIITAVLEWGLTVTSPTITGAHTVDGEVTTEEDGFNQADDITNACAENKDWYAFHSTSYNKGAILASAPAIEANGKQADFLSADTDCYADVATDVGSKLKALGYNRSSVWHTQDTAQNLDTCVNGRVLVWPPGSIIWWGKTLVGATASTLTSGQIKILLDKKINVYVEELGKNITKNGTAASGMYKDIIRDTDYAKSILTLAIFDELTKVNKFAQLDSNVLKVDQRMKAVFNQLFKEGVIKDDYTTNPPKVADIPVADRATRKLPNLPFTWTIQGAFQTVTITGVVSV